MAKPRAFTESGRLIALAVAIALLVGIVGPAAAQFFNFGDFGGNSSNRSAVAAAGSATILSRHISSRCAAASGAKADNGGFFQGAAAGEARDRTGAKCAGARRLDGGLARLRP